MSNLTLGQTKRLLEASPEDFITGYRADPTGKYGGVDNLETQPTPYRVDDMNPILRAMKYLKTKYNKPHPDPQQLAAFALKEGRSDFGLNAPAHATATGTPITPDQKDFMPSSAKLVKAINADKNFAYSSMNMYVGKDGELYDFPSAIKASELVQKAERLKKPLEALWNPHEKRYVQDYKDQAAVTSHPRNDTLVNNIYSNLGLSKPDSEPDSEPAIADIPTPEVPDMPISLPDSYRMGGRVRMI